MTSSDINRLLRFGVSGGFVTVVSYILYILSIIMGIHYLIASIIGWFGGIFVSYFINKSFTFSDKRKSNPKHIAFFFSGYIIQLFIGIISLSFFVELLNINENIAFFFTLALTTSFSYLFMNKFVFIANAES